MEWITITNAEELEKYYDSKTNSYLFLDENGKKLNVEFEFNLNTDRDITCADLISYDIKCNNLYCKNLECSRDYFMDCNVSANTIKCNNLSANSVYAYNVYCKNDMYVNNADISKLNVSNVNFDNAEIDEIYAETINGECPENYDNYNWHCTDEHITNNEYDYLPLEV